MKRQLGRAMVVSSRARALLVVSAVAAAFVLLALGVVYSVHDTLSRSRVVLVEDDDGYHEQVATGLPRAYDGRWGEQFHRNAGGHERAFREAHLNYDDYPADIYRGVPWIPFDPAATHQREINQKVYPPRKLARPHIQQSGANKGGEVWPVGWGTWHEGGPSQDVLRSHGIKVDHWPIDVYHGFPNPAWDESEHHQHRNVHRLPPADAHEAAHRQHESEAALKEAGVHVNGMPWDHAPHAYNDVDGMLDHLVSNEATPKYRARGVATQEHPYHFLLDERPSKPTQAEEIEGAFESGTLDHVGQRHEDAEEGFEEDPEGEALPELYREQEEREEEEEEEEEREEEEEEEAGGGAEAAAAPRDGMQDVYQVVRRTYGPSPFGA